MTVHSTLPFAVFSAFLLCLHFHGSMRRMCDGGIAQIVRRFGQFVQQQLKATSGSVW